MTCNTPKIWPHFGCNKHIFRLFSSLLFYFAQRHRGTSCLGSEWDQGVKELLLNRFKTPTSSQLKLKSARAAVHDLRAFNECFEEGQLSKAEDIFTWRLPYDTPV